MQLLYYSFYVGVPNTEVKDWKLQDDKIPAFSPREALILHRVMRSNCQEHSIKPDFNYYRTIYRKMIVFEKTSSIRITRVNFKKIQEFTSGHILEILAKDFNKK